MNNHHGPRTAERHFGDDALERGARGGRAGLRSAFDSLERLRKTYWPAIYAVARRHGNPPEAAEDHFVRPVMNSELAEEGHIAPQLTFQGCLELAQFGFKIKRICRDRNRIGQW